MLSADLCCHPRVFLEKMTMPDYIARHILKLCRRNIFLMQHKNEEDIVFYQLQTENNDLFYILISRKYYLQNLMPRMETSEHQHIHREMLEKTYHKLLHQSYKEYSVSEEV